MKNRKNDKNILMDIPAILCIAVAIICIAIVFTLNFRPLYYAEVNAKNLSDVSGFSEREIKENYRELIRWNSFTARGPLELPTIQISDDAMQHFDETKHIFAIIQITGIITVLLGIVFLFLRGRSRWRMLMAGGVTALATTTLIGAVYFIAGWEKFFVTFHQILFDNELWLFDIQTDPVILILPESFFMKCMYLIIGIILFLSLLTIITGIRLKKKS